MTVTAFRRESTGGGLFTGTLGVLRLDLRRDRFILPLWILGFGLPWAQIYVGSTAAAYPDFATRTTAVAAINSNSVMVALYGPVHNATIGSVGLWKAGMFTTLIAVATILTVIRHSRAEEDSGTGELVAMGAVGRLAVLAAAVLVATMAAVCVGLVGGLNLLTQPIPASGAFCFSAAVAASGVLFAGVAALAVQLTSTATQARAVALAALAAAFAIRAFGDVRAPALRWFSPLGWCGAMRPFAGDRWSLLTPFVTAAIILIVLAFRCQELRDFSAPAFSLPVPNLPRRGSVAGAAGLSRRLHQGAFAGWLVGLTAYALLLGSAIHLIGSSGFSSPAVRRVLAEYGSITHIDITAIGVAYIAIGMGATACGVSAILVMHGEEASGRVDALLTSGLSRTRWIASHLNWAFVGTGLLMLIAGAAGALAYSLSGDSAVGTGDFIAAAIRTLPAVWFVIAIAFAAYAGYWRLANAGWFILTIAITGYLLKSIPDVPRLVGDLSPYSHVPTGLHASILLPTVFLAIDVVLVTLGAVALHRRDVR